MAVVTEMLELQRGSISISIQIGGNPMEVCNGTLQYEGNRYDMPLAHVGHGRCYVRTEYMAMHQLALKLDMKQASFRVQLYYCHVQTV